MRPCPDCQVLVTEEHLEGCDVARCLWTGQQRLIHEMLEVPKTGDALEVELGGYVVTLEAHDCGRDVWMGQWPGIADATRLGWWCRWVEGRGWERCRDDHPQARPDLNRLEIDGVWNRETQRWEVRT